MTRRARRKRRSTLSTVDSFLLFRLSICSVHHTHTIITHTALWVRVGRSWLQHERGWDLGLLCFKLTSHVRRDENWQSGFLGC